jgi:hypothetical protein
LGRNAGAHLLVAEDFCGPELGVLEQIHNVLPMCPVLGAYRTERPECMDAELVRCGTMAGFEYSGRRLQGSGRSAGISLQGVCWLRRGVD